MGKIFCILGKSSTGKDTIYRRILDENKNLHEIVPYTTRPIREGETEGVEYHFVNVDTLQKLREENNIIECRCYKTIHGDWYYFTVKDEQINLEENDYLIIGTLESYVMIRDYFGAKKVVPIFVDIDDGERITRALKREKKQDNPKYEEMCRRFLADSKDFSEEKLKAAGVNLRFENIDLEKCIREIHEYIKEQL